jgi:hypothetical protein
MLRSNLIVYNKLPDQLDQEIEAGIIGQGLGASLKVCRTLQELRQMMEEDAGRQNMAVLVPSDLDDLEGLIALRLGDWPTKLILVLRQNDPTALARAHALRPRFLTFADSNLAEVAMVARNLIRGHQKPTYH